MITKTLFRVVSKQTYLFEITGVLDLLLEKLGQIVAPLRVIAPDDIAVYLCRHDGIACQGMIYPQPWAADVVRAGNYQLVTSKMP